MVCFGVHLVLLGAFVPMNLQLLVEEVWARWETHFRQPHIPPPSVPPARTVYAIAKD
jgi:hypothetical protein